jgi:hypothetical protein
MPHLEPTYLRYIYDGLIKGSIHPENAAELPEGLIGLYEEAFDENHPVQHRQQLLERFGIWALLKKEVSAQFIAEVLNQPEEEIQEYIATYSAWFNSPESGKYQLYHERLKVYLLQKLSEGEVRSLHEKLISRLELAIEEQKADEFEWYGLEFLVQHYAVNAMLNGDGSKLLDQAYNQNHWQRQLKISKGYIWTKSGLHFVMNWASKYNDDQVIECGLQLVDLHHQEQNAAPQIVALVAEGDFDSALKRIEQFGGNDKEGLQRKFVLYMLCLMELTLLESKNKPYQREGIEKILKHLDEHLPVDHSVLNWVEFLPTNLMFRIQQCIQHIDSTFISVFRYSKSWDFDWVRDKPRFSYEDVNLLIELTTEIKDVFWHSTRLVEIGEYCIDSKETEELGKQLIEKAIGLAEFYEGDLRNNLLKSLSLRFIEKGNEELAHKVISFFEGISKEKIDATIKFVSTFFESKNLVNSISSIRIEQEISEVENEYYRFLSISDLAVILSKSNFIKEALKLSEQIINFPRIKINTLNRIAFNSRENNHQAYFDQLQNSIHNILISIEDQWELDITYSELIDTYLEYNEFDKCNDLLDNIQDDYWKNQAILKLANYQLLHTRNFESAQSFLSMLPVNSDEQIEGILNFSAVLISVSEFNKAINELSKLWLQISNLEDDFTKNTTQSKCLQLLFSIDPQIAISRLIQKLNLNKGITDFNFKRSILLGLLNQKNVSQKDTVTEILLSLHLEKQNFRESDFFEDVQLLLEQNLEEKLLDFSKSITDFQFRANFLRFILKDSTTHSAGIKNQEFDLIRTTDKIQNTFWKLHSKIQNLELFNQLNNLELAQLELSKIDELMPDLSILLQNQIRIKLACQFIKTNEVDRGIALLDEIKTDLHKLSGEDQNRMNQLLSLAYLEIGNESTAFDFLDKVIEQEDQFVSLSLNSKNETRFEFCKFMMTYKPIPSIRKFINEVNNAKWKDESLALVLKNYLMNNDLCSAVELSDEFNNKNLMLNTWWYSGFQMNNINSFISYDVDKIENQELQLKYFLSGKMYGVRFNELTFEVLKQWIIQELNNPELCKVLLTKYAIKMLFDASSTESIPRFNQILNYQWTLDIKNQLPN